jgi:hypothetical protein
LPWFPALGARTTGSLLGFAAAEIFIPVSPVLKPSHREHSRPVILLLRGCLWPSFVLGAEFSYCEFPIAPQVREPKDFLIPRSVCFGRCSILAYLDPTAAPKDSSSTFPLDSVSRLVLTPDLVVFILTARVFSSYFLSFVA